MKKLGKILRIVSSAAFGAAVVRVGPALAQIDPAGGTKAPEPSTFVLLATATGVGGALWWLIRRK